MWFFLFLFHALYDRNPFHAQSPFLPLLQFLKSYSSLLKIPMDSKHVCTFSLVANLSSLALCNGSGCLPPSFHMGVSGSAPVKSHA